MSCPLQGAEGAELLLSYCARRLDAETRAWLERHMQLCPECRVLAEQQQAVWEALDYWDALPVSEDFAVRLREQVRRAPRRRWQLALGLWRNLRVPLAAASLLLGALLLWRVPNPPHVAPQPPAQVEVETVEAALEDIEMLRTLELIASSDRPRAQHM